MKSLLLCALIGLTLPILPAAEKASARVVQDLDWCSVSAPAQVAPNTSFEVSVTVKNAAEKAKYLCIHLHYSDKNGVYKGFLASGDAQALRPNKVTTWRLTFPADKDVGAVLPLVFQSENGTWDAQVKRADAKPISVR